MDKISQYAKEISERPGEMAAIVALFTAFAPGVLFRAPGAVGYVDWVGGAGLDKGVVTHGVLFALALFLLNKQRQG